MYDLFMTKGKDINATEFDLVILGSGPGGYVAAIRAGQLGMRVALIERKALGGVCLNRGCIPSKGLISHAEALSVIQNAEAFGISIDSFHFDFAKAVAHGRGVVQRLQKGVKGLLKKQKVEIVEGTGRFSSPDTIRVEGESGEMHIRGRHFIIACGTRIKVPSGVQPDGKRILTSDEALFLSELPQRMAILGGGYTGVEFAYIFSTYGVEVTLVEFKSQILPTEDPEAVAVIAKQFKRQGIKLLTDTAMEKIQPRENSVNIQLKQGHGNLNLEVDSVLVAMGRQANSENLGLDLAGVQTQNGFIQTDQHMQTSAAHIFAIGDIAGKSLLAHSAMAEGTFVAEWLAGKKPEPVDHQYIPRCTYCQPQLAAIGLSEEEARGKYDITVGKFPFSANGKALAIGEKEGFIKIIAEAQSGKILGAHMVGHGVTELISEISLAQRFGIPVGQIAQVIHPHPTLTEALMEAAAAAAGQGIHS